MDDGNTLLHHNELREIVLLRLNRSFMEYMRAHHMDVVKASSDRDGESIAGLKHGYNLAGLFSQIRAERQHERGQVGEKRTIDLTGGGISSKPGPLKQTKLAVTRGPPPSMAAASSSSAVLERTFSEGKYTSNLPLLAISRCVA